MRLLASSACNVTHVGVTCARSHLRFEDALADAVSLANTARLLSQVEVRRGDVLWTVRWVESV